MRHGDAAVERKIARLRRGGSPRVLDLFAGCGGLSLGFQRAGAAIVAGIELDPLAAASHGRNFHPGDPQHAVARDIAIPPDVLASELGLGPVAEAVDIIVGGPPCQSYARVGRAKLREIDEHPEAFRHDPRAGLYLPYLAHVRAFAPLAILVENVPDALNAGGHNIAEEMAEALESYGYRVTYTLLNAVNYGVPQMRERMILLAFRQELGVVPRMPDPTHRWDLPVGYEGSRSVALKVIRSSGLFGRSRYVPPPEVDGSLPLAVTASEAIGDLPPIDARAQLRSGELRRGARRFDAIHMAYDPRRPVSAYAAALKAWPAFEAPDGLHDHQIRYLPRDYELFALMRPASEYPELHRLAVRRFETEAEARGLRRSSGGWAALQKSMVPPYDPDKFPNKWWKLREDWPARTLMAHLGKDSYSHIHYDGGQARTISVREAARLQSFPDGFMLEGTMNPAFRQIGNAVPPLLAHALAVGMLDAIRSATARRRVAAVA